MINNENAKKEDKDKLIELNLGRPNIFEQHNYESWEKIHKIIKECEIKIIANGVFFWLDSEMSNNKEYRYGGGGYKYCFWFENKEDALKFIDYLDSVCSNKRYIKWLKEEINSKPDTINNTTIKETI